MADLFAFELTEHTTAAKQTAFDAVAGAEQWSEWARPIVRSARLTRAGSPDERGVGAVRGMGPVPGGPLTIKEQITEFEPGERIVYKLVTPAPVRNYRGEVRFAEAGGGTDIHWQVQFEELIPASGPLLRAGFRKLIGTLQHGLVRHLDQRG